MDGNNAAREQKCHLSPLFRFPEPPLGSSIKDVEEESSAFASVGAETTLDPRVRKDDKGGECRG